MRILARHRKEFRKSAIAPAVAAANFESCGGRKIIEWLTAEKLSTLGAHAQQYVTADVRRIVSRIESVAGSGWLFQGVDPLNDFERMEGGCFKSDTPRKGWKRDKSGRWLPSNRIIKYESQQGKRPQLLVPADPRRARLWLDFLADPSIPLIITEGAKKAAALVSAGYCAVGIPGITMWNMPGTQKLIPDLAALVGPGRSVYISLDQDTKPKAKRDTERETLKLSAATKKAGAKPKVVTWDPSRGKGVDDLICNHGPEAFAEAVAAAVVPEVIEIRKRSALGFDPNWTAPKGQKYLTAAGLVKVISKEEKLICVKAPKGTGKTELARELAEEAMGKDRPVLLISHRIQLATALGERIQVLTVYEVQQGNREARELARIEVSGTGLSICINSCHPNSQAQFRAEDWEDALVIIDEASQVWTELLSSDTMRTVRVPILREMQKLLSAALSPETRGQVLLMDADLDKITVDAIRGIAKQPDLEPWVAVSHYKGNPYQVTHHSKAEAWLEELCRALDSGQRLLVMTDSQRKKGRFSSAALAAYIRKNYPHLKILRVDSETLQRKDHPAYGCISKANEVFQKYDVVICSPSVETGISLDLRGHFDAVYGCYLGVLSENSVRQSLARLREPVPRVIHVAVRGLSLIGGGDTYWKAVRDSQSQKVKKILHDLFDAAADQLDSSFLPSQVEAYCKIAARHNLAASVHRELVLAQLADEGNTVEQAPDSEQDTLREIREETKEARHDRLANHGTSVTAAAAITEEAYQAIQGKTSVSNEAEALALERKMLEERYQQPASTDLYICDQCGFYPKLRLHYYLTAGRQQIKDHDREKISELLETSGDGSLFAPDVARSSLGLKIAVLEFLKVPKLLEMAAADPEDLSSWISNDHPLIVELAEKAKANSRAIRLALGCSVKQSAKPIVIARAILEKVGFKFGARRRVGGRGQQKALYRVEQCDLKIFKLKNAQHVYQIDRTAIFQGWTEKAEETAKTKSQTELQPIVRQEPVVRRGNKDLIYLPQVTTELPPPEIEMGAASGKSESCDRPQAPPALNRREQICLDILRTLDHWGQYLNVSAEVGRAGLERLWRNLSPPHQQRIAAMHSAAGVDV